MSNIISARLAVYDAILRPIPNLWSVSRSIAGRQVRYSPNELNRRDRVSVAPGAANARPCSLEKLRALMKLIDHKLPLASGVKLRFPGDAGQVRDYFRLLVRTEMPLEEANKVTGVEMIREISAVPNYCYISGDSEF